ncbi:cellobiose transport system substrate-binding protein [Friedmanniella endophytica]|uniref:Cellobiose transport system substrate-binding protein n=1 Tax=Microlunatus kandeliicorticis TaxID=1759536 RepID=A0A7W3ISD8_9ACTN|nr:extracellular solute-binding protein [Microlunatus kandeliicorticis]MBA8794359.1 cellobiose transport system substrate-binding protein [Microlunatus kandeliicorticis]
MSISSDPDLLVLWYWTRSINPNLLDQAARQIPDSTKRLRADVVGGNYDSKLRTSLAGGAYIPDIAGVNSNCSLYFPNEERFVDLNPLGGSELKSQFYDWKWQLGTTPKGRMCFWPMDTGPTGLYYRNDLFAKAGLPSDPDALGEAIKTWDGYLDVGTQLRKKLDIALDINAGAVFGCYLNSSEERYFDRQDRPIFSQSGSAVRKAWDLAVQAAKLGVTGNLQTSNDQNAGWSSGRVAGHLEAVWWGPILADTAPDTKGKWRLANQPVKPGNSGGSFLMVPTTSKDPQAAFDFIKWLTNAENQAKTFNTIQLFPSTPASFTGDTLKSDNSFYGGQEYQTFFRKAAEQVPITYVSPYENLCAPFGSELTNVETAGKDPNQAWDDAVAAVDQVLHKRGLV